MPSLDSCASIKTLYVSEWIHFPRKSNYKFCRKRSQRINSLKYWLLINSYWLSRCVSKDNQGCSNQYKLPLTVMRTKFLCSYRSIFSTSHFNGNNCHFFQTHHYVKSDFIFFGLRYEVAIAIWRQSNNKSVTSAYDYWRFLILNIKVQSISQNINTVIFQPFELFLWQEQNKSSMSLAFFIEMFAFRYDQD